MCSSGPGIIRGEAAHGKAAFQPDCGSWDCPTAGPIKAADLRAKIKEARPNRFFTLTIRHRPDRTLEQETELLKDTWRDFRLWWNRNNPDKKIECCGVWEVTGTRHVHIHAAARCAFVPQPVLSMYFKKAIDSFRQDIREIKSQKELARYLTTYITKGLVKLQGTHRYSATHGFFNKEECVAGDPFFSEMTWTFASISILLFANTWRNQGWEVDLQYKRRRCFARPP